MDSPGRCSSARMRSALLCLVFCLLQAAVGTTVIPLCESNETENCTTALIQTADSSQAGIAGCKPEMQDFCIHGRCIYLVDLQEHVCRCEVGYSGIRCVHSEFVTDTPHLSTEYVVLGIILMLLFFTAISIAAYYLYTWNQNKKKRQANNREYNEVDVHEKDPTLLPI